MPTTLKSHNQLKLYAETWEWLRGLFCLGCRGPKLASRQLLSALSPRPMLSPAEDMRGRIEADTSSSTLEEEFPPDLLEKTRGDKERQKHIVVLMWKTTENLFVSGDYSLSCVGKLGYLPMTSQTARVVTLTGHITANQPMLQV